MKISINRRIGFIAVIALLLTFVFGGIIYKSMADRAGKIKMKEVVVAKFDLKEGAVLDKSVLNVIGVSESGVPKSAVSDMQLIQGKRLTTDVYKGEMLFLEKTTSRGEKVKADDEYNISIKVDEISNFLSTQLEVGSRYGLFQIVVYEDHTGEKKNTEVQTVFLDEVRMIGLIDATGNEILENDITQVSSIIIGTKKPEVIDNIMITKEIGRFELVKADDNHDFTYFMKKRELLEQLELTDDNQTKQITDTPSTNKDSQRENKIKNVNL